MKSVLVVLAFALSATTAHAGDVFCGANKESSKGSNQYDTPIFWEKVDSTKGLGVFLKPNGQTLRTDKLGSLPALTLEDGDTAIYISFPEGKANLVTAIVKKDVVKTYEFTNMALAVGDNKKLTLIGNGVAVTCKEM